MCGCFQDNDNEDRKLSSNKNRQSSLAICADESTKASQSMAAKTQNAAQNENKMTESDELDDNLEIIDPAIPSTSTASHTLLRSKMLRFKIQDAVQDANTMTESDEYDNLEIVEMAIPSTSTAHHPLLQSKMLHRELRRENAVQEENKLIESNGHDNSQQIVEPAIPSTSAASHSMSNLNIPDPNSLKFEIDNIGKIMSICTTAVKRWLTLIDDKAFPEKEYLQEYLEGTDKLHELQCKEMKLQVKQEEIQEMEQLNKTVAKKEPIKLSATLLVHLPNNEHTTVLIHKGLALRQAVSKAMQHRKLTINDCAAYVKHHFSYFISWDTDISTLQCNEVFVETLDNFPVPIFVAHHFVNNTFLFGFCNFCAKSVLYGWYCKTCNRKFHTKCVPYAPALCEHIKRRKAYYQRLLANNPTTGIRQVRPRPHPRSSISRPSIKQIPECSSSAPNSDINQDIEISNIKRPEIHEKNIQNISAKRIHVKYTKHGKHAKHDKKHPDDIQTAEQAGSIESEDSIFSQESIRDWRVEHDEIAFGDPIGQGTYGTVYKAEWYGPVAVKKLNIKTITKEDVRIFKNEVNVLRTIRHKHVLLFMGCICKPYLGIITQWCDGSSLYHRLHIEEQELQMITIVVICRQTSEGMDYLHARNIHHRDLKSSNIFFHHGLHVKIGDFGLAVMRNQQNENEEQKNQPAGSVPWMAPEVLRMKEAYPYSFQSDVYSFGIVMYELFARELPYGFGTDKLYIIYNVGRGSLKPDLTKLRPDTPRRLKRLLKECIDFDRNKRPLFPYILRQMNAVFKTTPKIRRTTSLPSITDQLADTYIERDDDVQEYLEDDDYDSDVDTYMTTDIDNVKVKDIFTFNV